jgi:hypothetical protein
VSQAPARPLKWIAVITAVITLVLGLNQVVRVFAEVKTFADVVDPLLVVVTRGSIDDPAKSSTRVRAATCSASTALRSIPT